MRIKRPQTTAERHTRLWPLFALLVAAVLVPTVCVLWFMVAAVRNERLAVRQRLTNAYRRDMVSRQEQLDAYWRAKTDALTAADPDAPAEAFYALVTSRVCDSVVVYDAAGAVAYPAGPRRPAESVEPRAWAQARRLEFQMNAPGAAAIVYASLAVRATNSGQAARALLGRGRCLAKAGRLDEAVEVLTVQLADSRYGGATDQHGRLISPNAQLFALELMRSAPGDDPTSHRSYQPTFAALHQRLNDYSGPMLPAAQRLFLMGRLGNGSVRLPPFATRRAEELAGELIAAGEVPPTDTTLQRTRLPHLWRLATGDGRIAAMFDQERILAAMQTRADAGGPLSDAVVRVVPPGASELPRPLLSVSVSDRLPGWTLTVTLTGDDPFAAAAKRQVTVYLWTGTLVVVAIVLLAALGARILVRQMRLTRLKNNLIATVSHELKTPLASMRVLVDTLLAGRITEQSQATEYLEMIAKENQRLTRLIDNFLTFSRMERNKRAFDFTEVSVGEVVETAVGAVGERFSRNGAQLDVQVDADLPPVVADADALVIVLLNLLNNAWKYTGDDKHVTARAYADNGHVCLAVADNGIGMSRRTVRRIFQRFYQADRSLSRSTEGVGLGLSIVKFIVTAHGGAIDVESRVGHGSTFVVRLPVDGPAPTD